MEDYQPQKIIDAAEEAVGVESYKDIETQAQFNQFKKIMNQMVRQERQGGNTKRRLWWYG